MRQPSEQAWIPLVEALTWLRDNNACDLRELLAKIAKSVGLVLGELSEKERKEALTRLRYGFPLPFDAGLMARIAQAKGKAEAYRRELQTEWLKLADAASAGAIKVRGKAIGESEEIELSADDLRNCRFLSWLPEGPGQDLVARIERVDGTDDPLDGTWERLQDERNSGFHYVVVNQEQLLKVWPVPARKLPLANERRAKPWLVSRLRQLSAKSVSKAKNIR